MTAACDGCLRRAWLVAALAPAIGSATRRRPELLALGDRDLIAALARSRHGAIEHGYASFDAASARQRAAAVALEPICRHDERFPARLRTINETPAVLHVLGAERS